MYITFRYISKKNLHNYSEKKNQMLETYKWMKKITSEKELPTLLAISA